MGPIPDVGPTARDGPAAEGDDEFSGLRDGGDSGSEAEFEGVEVPRTEVTLDTTSAPLFPSSLEVDESRALGEALAGVLVEEEPGAGVSADEHVRGGAPSPALVRRLAEAITVARGSAPALRAAVEVAAYGLARTLRAARRSAVETAERFRLASVPAPPTVFVGSEREALGRVFGVDAAAAALEPKALPTDLPMAEAESVGDGPLGECLPLPRAFGKWREERERQARATPAAGSAGACQFSWIRLPPGHGPGRVWRWGPRQAAVGGSHEEATWLRLLAKEVAQGCIEVTSWDKVDLVTPVFIAYHPVTRKPRLVHDLRALNVMLGTMAVNYDRASSALCGGSVAAKLDILAAFRHLSLGEADRRWVCFEIDGIPFRWRALPFGASQSPALFTRMLAPVLAAAANPRWTFVVYVDDILVVANSRGDLDDGTSALLDVLRDGGWHIALEKCFLYALRVAPFLGVLVDLTKDCLRVSVAKAQRLVDICTEALKGRVVSLRVLQKIGGLLAFLAVATPMARFGRCGLNLATAEAESLPGRTVGVKGQLRDDLTFWVSNGGSLPKCVPVRTGDESTTVVTDAAGAPLRGFGGIAWPGSRTVPDVEGLLLQREKDDLEVQGAWIMYGPLRRLSGESSASLELEALLLCLQRLWRRKRSWVAGRRIVWLSDSTSAVSVPGPWRTKSPGLAAVAKRLFDFCVKAQCVVEPHWVSRWMGWMPAADWLSRQYWRKATAEWTIPREAFLDAVRLAGWEPTTDLYATRANRHCDDFASQWPEVGGQRGALDRSGDGVRGWAFPPFSQVDGLLRWLRRASDARVLAVLPAGHRVPSVLRVVRRSPLPPTRLIDVTGHVAAGFAPSLELVEVWSDGG